MSKKAKRRRFHEVSIHEDIRFRGPLNYQHLQILGWLCIVLSVVVSLMNLGGRINESLGSQFGNLRTILSYIATLSLPFLLLANFAKILNNAEGYRKQLITNGATALGIFVISWAFFSRYIVGTMGKLAVDPEDTLQVLNAVFRQNNKNGFLAFNLFIDLFLCTLFMYFLNARPSRVFTGKKVLILRSLALLPLALEILSWILKWKSVRGEIILPFWSFPLLTVKPPITFAVFMLLALHLKGREYRFCRHGRSYEEYQAFLQTNRNSFHFSVYLAVVMVVAGIIDLVITIFLLSFEAGTLNIEITVEELTKNMAEIIRPAEALGIGESITLLFVAPMVLLFSYSRVPKNKRVSMLIPAGAIVLILLVVLEAINQVIGYLPFEKINMKDFMDQMQGMAQAV